MAELVSYDETGSIDDIKTAMKEIERLKEIAEHDHKAMLDAEIRWIRELDNNIKLRLSMDELRSKIYKLTEILNRVTSASSKASQGDQ